MTTPQKGDEIKRCYLFAGVSDGDLQPLVSASRRVRYAKGGHIFSAGDTADGLRIITSGLVRVWLSEPSGRELTVALLEDGDCFGEIALFDELPRTAHATATEATECILVPRTAAEALLAQSPRFARHVITILCETLRRSTRSLGVLVFHGLEGRLAHKLHDLALDHARVDGQRATFLRKFSQAELAQMLGVTREAVNKRLNALARDDILSLTHGQVTILDLPRLAERAGLRDDPVPARSLKTDVQ